MKQYAHTVINFRTFIFEFVDPFTDDVTDRKKFHLELEKKLLETCVKLHTTFHSHKCAHRFHDNVETLQQKICNFTFTKYNDMIEMIEC